MDEQSKQLNALAEGVTEAWKRLDIESLLREKAALEARSQATDFWGDTQRAQDIMKQIARLDSRTKNWVTLKASVHEVAELSAMNDDAMAQELSAQIDSLGQTYQNMKEELKLNGVYDSYDALISIHAGAGGTDAQDWAQMLLRMYLRFFEINKWSVSIVDESSGEEAGIKSATMEVSGAYAFGKLKGEHGVHRLVRLSPFNADNLRQTSFAKVEVMPKIDQPEELVIDEKDLKIDVYRSGGHGGQSVNTTDSAVRVTHLPTGLTVAIQNERSQLQNRETAMTVLRGRLAQLKLEQHQEQLGELKGPNQSAEWGNQIRSYVLHPYKQVKDLRTRYETSDPEYVLDGHLEELINAYLEYSLSSE